jgi:two-component system NtrC family sensor kinase
VTNVDHIKTIIATQQSYALGSNMIETVPIAGLIDDALRMGEVSFSRHGIEVIKDYDDIASIETDRHKLLEILINVVSNARHSLKVAGSPKLQLGVHLRLTEPGISIAISDTGVGIPAENLDRVFQHGFTTKRSGHGFGLHACANAARELGGTITAASDGPGRGAVFTINLPLRHAKRGTA